MTDLVITKQAKKRAKRIRIKNESKWRWLKYSAIVFLFIAILSLAIGLFAVPYEEYTVKGIFGVIFSASLVLFVSACALLSNLTSQWVTNRMNERIWIEDHTLNHFIQTAFAAGFNSRNTDERGYMYAMDINSIHEAKFDERSRRVEFKAFGKGYHFSDVDKDRVDKEWPLKDFPAVFYDYTEPSLVETLEKEGIHFERCTLKFKIGDGGI